MKKGNKKYPFSRCLICGFESDAENHEEIIEEHVHKVHPSIFSEEQGQIYCMETKYAPIVGVDED